jgi:hypothetical protein
MAKRKTFIWLWALHREGFWIRWPYSDSRISVQQIYKFKQNWAVAILQKYKYKFEVYDIRDEKREPKFFEDEKAAKMAARMML